MELRQYQKDCVEKILWSLSAGLDGNSACVLPTASGKSVIIAELAHRLNQPLLILVPSKEILEQDVEKLMHYVDRSEIGIYSASAGEKTIGKFTFATIGSVYKVPEKFQHFGLVIIDELHLVSPRATGSMFMQFLNAIGQPRVIGFSATPYRLGTRYVWEAGELKVAYVTQLVNRMKQHFWARILYNVSVQELVDQGYLCKLEYIDRSIVEQSAIPLNKTGSEFNLEAFDQIALSRQELTRGAIEYAESVSKSVLVFCSSVAQAERLQGETVGSAVVTAKTPAREREQLIQDFRDGKIKTVFNVGVLTTGFDMPSLDCILLCRPTQSIALLYQMLGRGLRIAEGKTHCKIIDLTNTVARLGKIESIKLEKVDGQWCLSSSTSPQWHNRALFSFRVQPKKQDLFATPLQKISTVEGNGKV
jgi:DNA repair protein RadD